MIFVAIPKELALCGPKSYYKKARENKCKNSIKTSARALRNSIALDCCGLKNTMYPIIKRAQNEKMIIYVRGYSAKKTSIIANIARLIKNMG